MTEKEASKKECPFLMGKNLQYPYCIASDCMAWRTISAIKSEIGKTIKPETGYCGLAGKP